MASSLDYNKLLPPGAVKLVQLFRRFDGLHVLIISKQPNPVSIEVLVPWLGNLQLSLADIDSLLFCFPDVVKCDGPTSSNTSVVTLHPPGKSDARKTSRLNAVLKVLTALSKARMSQILSTKATLSKKDLKREWERVETEGWRAVMGNAADIIISFGTLSKISTTQETLQNSSSSSSSSGSGSSNRSGSSGSNSKKRSVSEVEDVPANYVAKDWLEELKKDGFYSNQVTHERETQGRAAIYQPLAMPLPAILEEALRTNLGIDTTKLYRHQAVCIDAIRQGKHVALSTATSSGKSLVYNLPVIEECLRDPNSVALYLFPTKALAQDQLRSLHELCGQTLPVVSCVLDGDTSYDHRVWTHKEGGGNIILSNPDMLHYTVLTQAEKYGRIFRNLRYVVIDEAHYYRGAFGAHVASVFRRLVRLVTRPVQFICCSATVSDPAKLLATLIPSHCLRGGIVSAGLDLEGSAVGRRLLVMWNPPLKDGAMGEGAASSAYTLSSSSSSSSSEKTGKRLCVEEKDHEDAIDPAIWHLPSDSPNTTGTTSIPRGAVPGTDAGFLMHGAGTLRVASLSDPSRTGGGTSFILSDDPFYKSAEDRVKLPVSFKGAFKREPGKSENRANAVANIPPPRPPRANIDDDTRRGSSIWETAALLLALMKHGRRVIVFAGTRRLTEYVLMSARKQNASMKPGERIDESKIVAYRGGYTKEDRRHIEQRMFSGEVDGIIATCALELGVDIGYLDVTITLSFPSSISSWRQQIGRAGRRGCDALSFFVPFGDSLIDQYFLRNPDQLFDGVIEDVVLDLENEHVLQGHLACASREEPLNQRLAEPDYRMNTDDNNNDDDDDDCGGFIPSAQEQPFDPLIWGKCYADIVQALVKSKERVLTTKTDRQGRVSYSYTNIASNQHPAQQIALRLIDPITISIIDVSRAGNNQVIDSVGYSRAFFEVFTGAVYHVQGRQFLISTVNIDLVQKDGHALCTPSNEPYRTVAMNHTSIEVLHKLPIQPAKGAAAAERCLFEFGVVNVTRSVSEFLKVPINRPSDVVESCPLKVDDLVTTTKGVWIDFPSNVCTELTKRGIDVDAALHTINHVLQAVAALTTMSDGDVACEHFARRRVLLYDKRPGGLGFCESLLRRHVETIEKAIDLLKSCPCDDGCVACTYSSSCTVYNEHLNKPGALTVLELMRAKMRRRRGKENEDSATGISPTPVVAESPQKQRRDENLREACCPANGNNHLVVRSSWHK